MWKHTLLTGVLQNTGQVFAQFDFFYVHTTAACCFLFNPDCIGIGFRAYPNNPLYCGRLQSPMPALSAKNVLNVEKTTPPSIFGLPPWLRTFRSAS